MIRIFDLLFSVIGLSLLSPFLIIVYILIRLESKGEGFYIQERIGKHGIPFQLYKFRSMTTGSDKEGLITVGEKDNRITKIGYFIRRYKIDELPQLWNVIKGDMSLVGPRPEVKKYTDLYTEEQKTILNVKPGITDWASIKYVDENRLLGETENPDETYINIILPSKIKLNMIFINNHTLKEYFKIIFATISNII